MVAGSRFRRSNTVRVYRINNRGRRIFDVQRNLEMQVHCSLKVAMQMDSDVEKVFSMLAFTGQGIVNRSCNVMLQLRKILFGSPSEYCIQSNPHTTGRI